MADKDLIATFLGFNLPYSATLARMQALHEQVCLKEIPDQLLLLEHEPVITYTAQHLLKSLKTSEEAIKDSGIQLLLADRGGDLTFHGPGQLVGYPLISLKHDEQLIDIARFIRGLEQALFLALKSFGLKSLLLLPGYTGIWVKDETAHKVSLKKLVAIGVGVKNGVSKHGFALNIQIDHEPYTRHIVACGLKDRGVITLKEVFSSERLEMPSYFDIVTAISQSLSQGFSLTLKATLDGL